MQYPLLLVSVVFAPEACIIINRNLRVFCVFSAPARHIFPLFLPASSYKPYRVISINCKTIILVNECKIQKCLCNHQHTLQVRQSLFAASLIQYLLKYETRGIVCLLLHLPCHKIFKVWSIIFILK